MLKNILKIVFISPLLMAFQCEDELEEATLGFNNYKVEISDSSTFSQSDTIWIRGCVSSMAFDQESQDSVFVETPQDDMFSIYELVESNQVSNAVDAIDEFDLMFDIGQFSTLPSCENGQLLAFPELQSNNSTYTYRIGLKANKAGDYVISWKDAIIENASRNEFIIMDYPIENYPDQIGFNSCGEVSWRFVEESEKEFYFRVE